MMKKNLNVLWVDISKILFGITLTVAIIALLALVAHAEEYKVYRQNQYGFTNPFPAKTVTVDRRTGTIEKFNHHPTTGVKNPFPSERIEVAPSYRRNTTLPQTNSVRRSPQLNLSPLPLWGTE